MRAYVCIQEERTTMAWPHHNRWYKAWPRRRFDTGLTAIADPNNYLLFKFSPQNTILKTGFFRLRKIRRRKLCAPQSNIPHEYARKYSHIWWHNDRVVDCVRRQYKRCLPIWLARMDYANCYTQFYKFTFFMLAWKQRRNYSSTVKRVKFALYAGTCICIDLTLQTCTDISSCRFNF